MSHLPDPTPPPKWLRCPSFWCLQHFRHTSASGPLHLLSALPGPLFSPDRHTTHSLQVFAQIRPLLNVHTSTAPSSASSSMEFTRLIHCLPMKMQTTWRQIIFFLLFNAVTSVLVKGLRQSRYTLWIFNTFCVPFLLNNYCLYCPLYTHGLKSQFW